MADDEEYPTPTRRMMMASPPVTVLTLLSGAVTAAMDSSVFFFQLAILFGFTLSLTRILLSLAISTTAARRRPRLPVQPARSTTTAGCCRMVVGVRRTAVVSCCLAGRPIRLL